MSNLKSEWSLSFISLLKYLNYLDINLVRYIEKKYFLNNKYMHFTINTNNSLFRKNDVGDRKWVSM